MSDRTRDTRIGFAKPGTPTMVHHPACPDPSKARAICSCGENTSCSACGWGSGNYPCRCHREHMQRVPDTER